MNSHAQCNNIPEPQTTTTSSQTSSDDRVILVAEGPTGGADQLTDLDRRKIEIAPIGLDAREGDVGRRWDVQGGHGARKLIRDAGVLDLPRDVDAVNHGVQRIPDWVLRRDVDAVHGTADREVSGGMDAQGGAADDAVESELEGRGVGAVNCV